MPDIVEFKPVRARRPHRSVRPKLLNIKGLDRRTAARKAFDALVAEIEHDLGGREQLSAIEKSLIQAYAGSAILLDDLNARVVLGQEIDVGTHAQITSATGTTRERHAARAREHRTARWAPALSSSAAAHAARGPEIGVDRGRAVLRPPHMQLSVGRSRRPHSEHSRDSLQAKNSLQNGAFSHLVPG